MHTLKPNNAGEVTLYGVTTKINKNAKTVKLYGVEYKVDWGSKKNATSKATETPEVGNPEGQPELDVTDDTTDEASE